MRWLLLPEMLVYFAGEAGRDRLLPQIFFERFALCDDLGVVKTDWAVKNQAVLR
jgi:hypothetical protein